MSENRTVTCRRVPETVPFSSVRRADDMARRVPLFAQQRMAGRARGTRAAAVVSAKISAQLATRNVADGVTRVTPPPPELKQDGHASGATGASGRSVSAAVVGRFQSRATSLLGAREKVGRHHFQQAALNVATR